MDRSRSGFSLVEVLVVVALSAVVIGTAISLIVGVRQWDRRFQGRTVQCERLLELAETMRADIRAAADVATPADGVLVITSASGDVTRYELEQRGCSRKVESTDEAGQLTELFTIGPTTSWNVERRAAGRRPLVRVTLDRTPSDSRSPRRAPLLVCAALGADATLTTSNE